MRHATHSCGNRQISEAWSLNTDISKFALTPAEKKQFHTDGFIGPFSLPDASDMTSKEPLIRQLLKTSLPDELPEMIRRQAYGSQRGFGRHHDNTLIYSIATDPGIVNRVQDLLGQDLLLWRTMFFSKDPGAKPIPWHQDYDGWPIEPFMVISAWVAIDHVTKSNGCIQLIPGSHRKFYPLVETPEGHLETFTTMADPTSFDETNQVDMELQPGQFFMFNERLLHRSPANTSNRKRLGLAVRYITPQVRLLDGNDRAMLIRGRDTLGFNTLVDPPAAG